MVYEQIFIDCNDLLYIFFYNLLGSFYLLNFDLMSSLKVRKYGGTRISTISKLYLIFLLLCQFMIFYNFSFKLSDFADIGCIVPSQT